MWEKKRDGGEKKRGEREEMEGGKEGNTEASNFKKKSSHEKWVKKNRDK